MDYKSIWEHPDLGEVRNVVESAKYLGVSRGKFRRIAPAPCHIQDAIYPFWATRILDILPLDDDFDHDSELRKGKACGHYLVANMPSTEMQKFRSLLLCNKDLSAVLAGYGVAISFCGLPHMTVYRDGVLSAIKDRVIAQIATMSPQQADRYLREWGGSYESLGGLIKRDY